VTAAWTDEARAVEGRPDSQEEAVALYTMHAAKGLEWPIVVPVNTMTMIMAAETAITDRSSGRFYCPVFGVKPTGYQAARDAEKAELDRERIRLWYVAATRARELLVLPRLDVAARSSAWISLLDLALGDLPALDLSHLPTEIDRGDAVVQNTQSREIFAAEATSIAARQRSIHWLAPSRDEGGAGAAVENGLPQSVQGGRERGLILHKLIEEVLTGETPETPNALAVRAQTLIVEMGHSVADDPTKGLSPAELAKSAARALSVPEIVALRPGLLPEFPVYASVSAAQNEEATAGIADAITFREDGAPDVIVDWKSDVSPTSEVLEHYRAQVGAYLGMTGANRGLIVLATTGMVISVARKAAAGAAS
jgi:exodeoxyribonuclease-5